MSNILKTFLKKSILSNLNRIGFDVKRYPAPDWTEIAFPNLLAARNTERSGRLSEEVAFLLFCAKHAEESQSQLFQDLFVRWQLHEKRDGYFVEFGATDGISLSNSQFVELHRHWSGILAEPARCWHERLTKNRACAIDTRCVWTTTGEKLRFNEVSDPELSTIESFSANDINSELRKVGNIYEVKTVSLNDLLAEHNAPAEMDYLSIDTEGSELSILENLDFSRYNFRIITVEHNNMPNREKIFNLLHCNGYQRKFTKFSSWDDWYVSGKA